MKEPDDSKQSELPPHYRIIQKGLTTNIAVTDLESLVTHHPGNNFGAYLSHGIPVDVEDDIKRSYGVINGQIQEIETRRSDAATKLKDHQVLLIKDFILEDSRIQSGGIGSRKVDVPSPVSGYVGRVSPNQGLVEIYDHADGDVIARVLHLDIIDVKAGSTVRYGQTLGIQGNQGLRLPPGKSIHVHAEIDTRYYQSFENYISDLSNGRLVIDQDLLRDGIVPLPVLDDGSFRLGEMNPRIKEFQELLLSKGYQGAHGVSLNADGVYRLEMQPAVLAYQRDHGLAQTGDIDRSTLHIALPHRRGQPIDRLDHVDRVRAPFAPLPNPDEPLHMFGPGPDDYQRHPERSRNDPRNPEHRDHAFYELLKRNLPPDTSDEMVAHVMLEAKIGRVKDADQVDRIMVHEDRVFVMGKTSGFRAAVDLSQTPPPLQETAQRSKALDVERNLQRQQWTAQEQALSQNQGMSRSL